MNAQANAGKAPALQTASLLAYGGIGLPLAFVALPIYVHVPALYAQQGLLSLAGIGTVLLIARLWDAVIDPLIGVVGDRYLARGAGRLYALVIAAPLLFLGLLALLRPPPGARFAWLAASLFTVYLGYSLASVNHHAWGAELACGPRERTRITACREGFALFGVILASLLPGLLGSGLAGGLAQLVWVFGGLLALALIIIAVGVPRSESLPQARRGAEWSAMWQVFRHHRFRALLAVFALSGIAAAIPATLVVFFIVDVLHAEHATGFFLAIYFLFAALGLPVWVRLSHRVGRVRAWFAAMLLALTAFALAALLGEGQLLGFGMVCALSGFALGADLALPPSLLADLADEDTLAGAGSYFGWWNFVAKLNLALAAGLALPALHILGYSPGIGEEGGVQALAAVYALLPSLLKLLAALLLWRLRHRLEGSSSP